MTRAEIDNIIVCIMVCDGEGSTDGHDVLTDFVFALVNGGGEKWAAEYTKNLKDANKFNWLP